MNQWLLPIVFLIISKETMITFLNEYPIWIALAKMVVYFHLLIKYPLLNGLLKTILSGKHNAEQHFLIKKAGKPSLSHLNELESLDMPSATSSSDMRRVPKSIIVSIRPK